MKISEWNKNRRDFPKVENFIYAQEKRTTNRLQLNKNSE